MNIQHVTSLEMSKKLVEAGWKKDTEFWWVDMGDYRQKGNEWYKPRWTLVDSVCVSARRYNTKNNKIPDEQYPAPLATEILEELHNIDIEIFSRVDFVGCLYYYNSGNNKSDEFVDKSLPNALAQMYCYLKKEKII